MHLVWRKTEFRKTVFVQEGLTTSDLRVVTEVPAEVCRQCDEKTFAPE
ncbi:MAG TPA: YgiT-type zinc finger protein, partial [Deltaproteobacteria bacterium]|nr:YgiT-type zinc finger protein [Deltaproteobacteria bacterium]